MSAFFDSENQAREISAAGLDGFIAKPIMKAVLLTKIAALFSQPLIESAPLKSPLEKL